MVRTRRQVKIAKEWRAEMDCSKKIRSYASMKEFYRLPYRYSIDKNKSWSDDRGGNFNTISLRHPCFSTVAVLDQIRRLRPDIPLAPQMFLTDSDTPLWKKVYWKTPYLVPVFTHQHIELFGIEYTSPTSIYISRFYSKADEKAIYNAVYRYLPWVRDIRIGNKHGGIVFTSPKLKNFCVPTMAYAVLNINYKKSLWLEFLGLHLKMEKMKPEQRYTAIMDAWQSVVRPTT